MMYTLPEIKKEIKHLNVVKITIWLEEYGEGFNVYSAVDYLDKYLHSESKYFDLSEEEKLGKAETRAKRVVESLIKAGYKAEYTGVANC